MIRVIVKESGKAPREVTIRNDLKTLQELVGGRIEQYTVRSDLVLFCNEEGILLHLPYNCAVYGSGFVGTIIVTGADGEGLTDCPITVEEFLEDIS